jgi:hypothetical protein
MKFILRAIALIVGLPALLILGLWIAELIHAGDPIDRKPYYTEQSPDRHYKIVVVYGPDFWSLFSITMPGQGGAGNYPGIVMLMDAQGHELARAPVDMMQTVPGGVIWLDDEVSVIASEVAWPLPTKTTNE